MSFYSMSFERVLRKTRIILGSCLSCSVCVYVCMCVCFFLGGGGDWYACVSGSFPPSMFFFLFILHSIFLFCWIVCSLVTGGGRRRRKGELLYFHPFGMHFFPYFFSVCVCQCVSVCVSVHVFVYVRADMGLICVRARLVCVRMLYLWVCSCV